MKRHTEELHHEPNDPPRIDFPYGPARGVILTPSAFRNSTSLFRLSCGVWEDKDDDDDDDDDDDHYYYHYHHYYLDYCHDVDAC